MGRPSQADGWLTEDALLTLKGWARDGFSNKQIAEKIGISVTTFCDWQRRFPQFAESIKKGRVPVAEKVVDAFYSRCDWKEVTEEKTELIVDGNNNILTKRVTKTKKWIPPDTAAMIFALKNLKPNLYREKVKSVEDIEEQKARIEQMKATTERMRDGDAAGIEEETVIINFGERE